MEFTGAWNTDLTENILSGYYSFLINSGSGSRAHLYEFSSPFYPISNFNQPYGAILRGNSQTNIAVGRKINNLSESIISDRSGKFYYYDNELLFGTCHGYGKDDLININGFNFYNAFYPAGYFAPPFGENLTILKATEEGITVLDKSCSKINITEYSELFGINSKTASNSTLSSSTLPSNQSKPLSSPKQICPETATATFFDEFQLNIINGTSTAIGGNFYNSNPIPTSLDNYEIRLDTRYQLSGDEDGNNYILFNSGRPIPSYGYNNQENKLNNTLCQASTLETSLLLGHGTNGLQLAETVDVLFGAVGDQTSFIGTDDPWNLWHFTYKENSDTFPFYNNFTSVDTTKGVHVLGSNEGTQIFAPILSNSDYYWKNRQCPDTVDFLPWTLGASIYACPSYHFDVPYYAALNKFGFYGTRFLNSCSSLNLDNTWSGINNVSELAQQDTPLNLGKELVEPEGIDSWGGGSFTDYDNLLKIANDEESYSNMYALNKGFFLWSNYNYILNDENYSYLSNKYDKFTYLFNSLINPFSSLYSGGLGEFISAEPSIKLNQNNIIVNTGWKSNIIQNNDLYNNFIIKLNTILSGSDFQHWDAIEDKYSYYVSDGNSIDETFYKNIIEKREQRFLTRYLENTIRGNPIDLFPLNNISFSLDKSRDYLENTNWGRRISSFGKNSDLPEISKRYFMGAYGNTNDISGFTNKINSLNLPLDTNYYPGFFNDKSINRTLPQNVYKPILSGEILDNKGRKFSSLGWLVLGYNEIGKLHGDFSCFTPILTQNPLAKTFCKIGQSPTLRVSAVDYHTLPEDKISTRYREIIYWAYKLKLLDKNFKLLYPLKYKWYRINKNNFDTFLKNGDFSLAEEANESGEWACLEGDNSCNCTIIHPSECSPIYSKDKTNVSDYTFIKGAKKGIDDLYKYFCVIIGRFGIRISEVSELVIEDWIKFDVSFKNGLNSTSILKIDFEIVDYNGIKQTISFNSSNNSPYLGYMRDEFAVVESQIEQKIPPPNAGWGDVTAYKFIGPIKYIGALRSYTPSTLNDTRGLRETWGRLLDYGSLIQFSKTLSQQEGDWLYGYSHLPICENYTLEDGKAGIKVLPYLNNNLITHWSLGQRAVASFNSNVGVKWDKLSNVGALYPPILNKNEDYESMGVGHWQWGNNFGAIKRFGYLSNLSSDDITFIGNGEPTINSSKIKAINDIKEKYIKSTTLAGENCGYSPYGFGRNMIYYIETFDRFYLYCDPLKKKNITNKTYMNPGIRQTNSAIQYFWLGKPNNTYLERRPMYGPYAYQWRIKRHNRDRNGNGFSEAFYSMGYDQRYTDLIDAPAIYGLYPKVNSNPVYTAQVTDTKNKRKSAGFNNEIDLRNIWFGKSGGEGSARLYGNTMLNCDMSPNELCDYFDSATSLANSINFEDYSCSQNNLLNGKCFDPCLSVRYGQGFFPGGKSLNLFGYTDKRKIRLVANANYKNNSLIENDEKSTLDDSVFFRSPLNTPHARQTKTKENIIGISPCQDGGSDHCNYITPTIHIGTSSFLQGKSSSFSKLISDIESLVGNSS